MTSQASRVLTPAYLLICALSLSIGWGIRGNFGHEAGAMMPGALTALAVTLLSGRKDWQARAVYFAAFGALGWSFGGSISYMRVIAYTHSGHSPSVIYGFACLWIVGFLWASVGGAGTALPAFLSHERLTEFAPPLATMWGVWIVRDVVEYRISNAPEFRHNDPLYWYDSDWTAALTAVAAMLLYCGVRRKIDKASSLILSMALGWFGGMLLLVVLMNLHMTPPRSDNWAGSVGMVVGMWVFLQKNGLSGVTYASIVTGFIGGIGFSGAALLKLIEMKGGGDTNWHSVLEQSYGAINGIAVAIAMAMIVRRAPRTSEEAPGIKWADSFAYLFLLLSVLLFNMQKNPEEWVKQKALPEVMFHLPTIGWFSLLYFALTLGFLYVMTSNRKRPIALFTIPALPKTQLLYLTLLWIFVMMNFERALVHFSAVRLVTEAVIFFNAVVVSALILTHSQEEEIVPIEPLTDYRNLNKRAAIYAIASLLDFSPFMRLERVCHEVYAIVSPELG
ncbi:MAG: hypothetical protein NT023_03580, partial [Armatimonadetes bacterium]|nr:hypothetical protein [Armatimonadota bacterium]